MVYLYGIPLAQLQDSLHEKFLRHEKPTKEELQKLNNNLWITLAHHLAPGNLVIRNYCLQDLFNGSTDHSADITILFYKLAQYRDDKFLWAEGYSYWLYTKTILKTYTTKFLWAALNTDIGIMEKNFRETGYLRDGVLYPAPYGDLRDIPLEDHLQGIIPPPHATIAHVTREKNNYSIAPRPMRMNVHTPKNMCSLYIQDGRVYHTDTKEPYRYYEGWEKKYQSKRQERMDYIDPRRWL